MTFGHGRLVGPHRTRTEWSTTQESVIHQTGPLTAWS